MLDIILSHWMTYVYVAYVVVLIVLCIVYRPRVNTVYHKLRQLRPRTWQTPAGFHNRLVAPEPHPRHFR